MFLGRREGSRRSPSSPRRVLVQSGSSLPRKSSVPRRRVAASRCARLRVEPVSHLRAAVCLRPDEVDAVRARALQLASRAQGCAPAAAAGPPAEEAPIGPPLPSAFSRTSAQSAETAVAPPVAQDDDLAGHESEHEHREEQREERDAADEKQRRIHVHRDRGRARNLHGGRAPSAIGGKDRHTNCTSVVGAASVQSAAGGQQCERRYVR